jgi:hypothetical protein
MIEEYVQLCMMLHNRDAAASAVGARGGWKRAQTLPFNGLRAWFMEDHFSQTKRQHDVAQPIAIAAVALLFAASGVDLLGVCAFYSSGEQDDGGAF